MLIERLVFLVEGRFPVNPPTIYRDRFVRRSVSVPIALMRILLYLTLPHPPRPLKSVEMPSGVLSATSSRGIVAGMNEDMLQ